MSKLTKVELVQINSKLAADNAALRAQLGAAQADIAVLRKQVNEACAMVEAVSRPTMRVQQHMPAWQVARAEAMNAAKTIAMQSGRVVKV